MERVPGGDTLTAGAPQFFPKKHSTLDLPFLLSIIAARPEQRLVVEVDLDTAFCIVDCRLDNAPIVYTSSSFEKMTGYSEAECLGKNCRFLQGPDTNPDIVNDIRRSFENCTEERFKLINYKKDGTKFLNYLTMIPIFDDDHNMNVVYSLGIQSDVPWKIRALVPTGPENQTVQLKRRRYESDAMDDVLSAMSGFTGEVQTSNESAFSENAMIQEKSVLQGTLDDPPTMPKNRTFLRRDEDRDSAIDYSNSMEGHNMKDSQHLNLLYYQLCKVDMCRKFALSKRGSKIPTKAKVLQLLAYMEGLVTCAEHLDN